jgi:molybdopterin synthase catalytic subunit
MEEVEVTVLLFAAARAAAGAPSTTLRVAPGTTPYGLAELLAEHYGEAFARVLQSCAVWVNGEPPRAGQRLSEGDEVAVLPPVSGGGGAVSR